LKTLRCDASKLRPRFVQLDVPVKIMSGRVTVGGGRYGPPYLRYYKLAVQIGGQRFSISPFTSQRVRQPNGDCGFRVTGATHLRFRGRVKIDPLPQSFKDGYGEITLCRGTAVEFLFREGKT